MPKRGFTLIEMLVTVAIMMMLVGIGTANFIHYREKKEVKEAAEQLRELFVAAKVKASARQTPESEHCSPIPDAGAQKYPIFAFHLSNVGTKTIEIHPVCGTNQANAVEEAAFLVDHYTLPQNVMLDGALSVYFYSLHGGVDLGNGNTTKLIKVANSRYAYQFQIDQGGNISEIKATTP